MRRTGTIIQIRTSDVYVMTDESLFFSVKKRPGMYLGQQIEFSNREILSDKKITIYKVSSIAAGIAAVFILFFLYFWSFESKEPVYAFISIDINPSLELCINEENAVIETIPVNLDARSMMENLDIKGKTLESALPEILNRCKRDGFLNTDSPNTVLISAALNKDIDLTSENSQLDHVLHSLKKQLQNFEKENIRFELVKASLAQRNVALQNNISTGRYIAYKKASGSLTIEEAREKDISEVLNHIADEPAALPTARPAPIPTKKPAMKTPLLPTPTHKQNATPAAVVKPSETAAAVYIPVPAVKPKPTPVPVVKPIPAPVVKPIPTPVPMPAVKQPKPSVKPPAAARDIALGTSPSATSYLIDHLPQYATDGDPASFWSCPASGTPWIQTDLGEIYKISEMKIKWSDTNYAKLYNLDMWDGYKWVPAVTVKGRSGWNVVKIPNPFESRYIRITCLSNNSAYYTIYEWQVY
ncbi:MAG: discoidin domain-containing protein [Clostridia bacterium]|nr:discoidin domain-containing protein [Clostridia bacterium]